jgi:hypothetical protein
MPDENEINFAAFRDCISVAVIRQADGLSDQVKKQRASERGKSFTGSKTIHHAPESSASELADFVDFIAEEAFPALPAELKALIYQAVQKDAPLAEKYATPLLSDIVEAIANMLPSSIEDSLVSYQIIDPPSSDMSSFLAPVLNNYISAVTTPPPHPLTTRASACEICERDWITLTYHHLIPRGVHAKVLKRGWHPEHMLNNVAWLCRACHSFIHQMASNEELAKEYFTVEMIMERYDVQRFAAWVGGIRWKKR